MKEKMSNMVNNLKVNNVYLYVSDDLRYDYTPNSILNLD